MSAVGVAVAAVAGFVVSATWYSLLPATETPDRAPRRSLAATMVVELVRNVAVAGLVTGLLVAAGWSGLGRGALLGVSLGTLPIVLLVGAVFHDGAPAGRSAHHAVDWLAKLGVIGAITGLFN